MQFTALIPARMTSTRLPQKPLADIGGIPMVVHTARRAIEAGARTVAVACDDARIVEACSRFDIQAILTDPNHPTGTDRLSEAARILNLSEDEIVVNVQGDEPLIPPSVVSQVAQALADSPDCAIATAAHPIADVEAFLNPNVVKVELNSENRALTFSRSPLPWPRDAFKNGPTALPEGLPVYHHIGLYAYRAGFLAKFPKLAPAPIEKFESLEQLRALWHGFQIRVMILNDKLPAGVDTAEDLERVRAIVASQK